MRNRWLAASLVAAAAVVGLAACGSSSSTPPSGGSTPKATSTGSGTGTTSSSSDMASGIKTASIAGRVVLTDSAGFVLYWFANDTPTKSNCSGTCASYWPPLIGTPTLGSGVSLTGTLGTIKRSNGQLQATYDGHPLYLYKSDTSAGMASGNDLNESGGLWWAMTSSGAKIRHKITSPAPASTSSSSGSSGSGGYGY
jgi:predicted lipoprotein with Yx(FWY)xxD motif